MNDDINHETLTMNYQQGTFYANLPLLGRG